MMSFNKVCFLVSRKLTSFNVASITVLAFVRTFSSLKRNTNSITNITKNNNINTYMTHDVSLVVNKMYETTFTISASIFGFPCEI